MLLKLRWHLDVVAASARDTKRWHSSMKLIWNRVCISEALSVFSSLIRLPILRRTNQLRSSLQNVVPNIRVACNIKIVAAEFLLLFLLLLLPLSVFQQCRPQNERNNLRAAARYSTLRAVQFEVILDLFPAWIDIDKIVTVPMVVTIAIARYWQRYRRCEYVL
mgnify:CR=1 FL=1